MQFRRSIIADRVSAAASSVTTFDLPVNPLSHLIYTMRFLNVTDEATLAQVLARISNITVTRVGQVIFNMSGADLQKFNGILFKNMPILNNQVATDNAARYISLIIPFSRVPYNPNEGLPATQRGELKLQITLSSSEADADNIFHCVEAVEMLGASPKQYLKVTTLTQTMSSGVDNDVPLPIGNKYAGVIVFSTTVPTSTAYTTTVDKVRYLLNNVENMFVTSEWENLHGELLLKTGQREDYDASADNDDLNNYGILDFSPLNDDTWLVDTKGASQSVLKITAGDGSAARVMPLELVAI